MRTAGKWLAAICVIIVGAGGAWYWLSPGWAVDSVRTAALSHDPNALARNIDFATLRANLKAQFNVRLTATFAKAGVLDPDALERRKAYLATMVDDLVSPTGLKVIFQRAGDAPKIPDAGDNSFAIERHGLSEFVVYPPAHPEMALVFTRYGLGWQITDVQMPFDLQKTFATTPDRAAIYNPE